MLKHICNDKHAKRRNSYLALHEYNIILDTISLNDFLVLNNAPEGSEYEILRSFPFNEWEVNLFTVEHNYSPQRTKIRELFNCHGYSVIEKDFDDWYYHE